MGNCIRMLASVAQMQIYENLFGMLPKTISIILHLAVNMFWDLLSCIDVDDAIGDSVSLDVQARSTPVVSSDDSDYDETDGASAGTISYSHTDSADVSSDSDDREISINSSSLSSNDKVLTMQRPPREQIFIFVPRNDDE